MSTEPQASAPVTVVPRTESSSAGGGLFTVIGTGLGYVLFPLIVVGKLFVFRVSERQGNQVAMFTSFSSLIYTWPIVFVGFLCTALQHWGIGTPAGLGWTWVVTVLFVLLVLGTDINRNVAMVWSLVLALFFTTGLLIHSWYPNIPILSMIYNWFSALGVHFEPGTAMAISTILAAVLLVTLVQASFDGRHEISSREVTHRRLLRASESLPLSMNRVRLDWPDMLEMITLFGAGHLVVIDNLGKEVMRIPNIPFLWFFRDEVNRILDIMATSEVAPSVLDSK